MRQLKTKLKPSRGFSHGLYVLFNILLPLLVLLLVRSGFANIAYIVVLLSKWRMFAVRPRFWLANVRANAVDIMVGLSVVALTAGTASDWLQLVYAAAWAGWLLFIKPRNDVFWISAQAFIGQAAALTALFSVLDHVSLMNLVISVGFVCFFAAHHFFYGFDEQRARLLAYIWGYFAAALTWVLGHWLIYYYDIIAQPTLVLLAISSSLGTLYYLDHFDRLSKLVRRQIVFVLVAVLLVVMAFSDWGDRIV